MKIKQKYHTLALPAAALLCSSFLITSTTYAAGYLDLGFGISTKSLESEGTFLSENNSSLSPDIDLTLGFSFAGIFIGGKYISQQVAETGGGSFSDEGNEILARNNPGRIWKASVKTEQVGATKGPGLTIGLVRNGLSLLFTKLTDISQNGNITSTTEYSNGVEEAQKGSFQLSDGDGYQLDFFYGLQFGPNIYFGPKVTYSKIIYKTKKVDEQKIEDFKSQSQSKMTPKLGVVATF